MAIARNDLQILRACKSGKEFARRLRWINLIVFAPDHEGRNADRFNTRDRINKERLCCSGQGEIHEGLLKLWIGLKALVDFRIGSYMQGARQFEQRNAPILACKQSLYLCNSDQQFKEERLSHRQRVANSGIQGN